MNAFFIFLSGLIFAGGYVHAADEQTTETLTMPAPPVTKTIPTPSLLLGLKSYNDTGRFGTLNDSKGQTVNGKQEGFLGYRADNGWGGFVQFTQYRYQYNDSTRNKWALSDTSLSLVHPDLVDDGHLKILGLFRTYIPQTDRSKSMNIRQHAYYSTQLYFFGHGRDLFNQLIPRWFVADRYGASDTTFYVEDRTVYTQKINSWSRWGIGNWFQYEKHAGTADGYVSELIPQFDFIVSQNFFIGPRLSLPILSQNSVYDGPKNTTWDQARAELYFQVTL